MKFLWPPTEETNWTLHTYKTQTKLPFFFPLQKHGTLLLAFRVDSPEPSVHLEIPVAGSHAFAMDISSNTWTMFPYPIEEHAIGAVWSELKFPSEALLTAVHLGYVPWSSRTFRMRAFLNGMDEIILAYRYNKNGQVVAYLPPFDTEWRLPEDTYLIPKTTEINSKSILLVSAKSTTFTKRAPENRYFAV